MSGRVSLDGRGDGDEAVVYFQDRELLRLIDKAEHESIKRRSQPAMRILNELWRSGGAVSITTQPRPDGTAIQAGPTTIVVVLPGDVPGDDHAAVVKRWADAIRAALDLAGEP